MRGVLIDSSIIIDYLRQKDKSKTILVKLEQKQIPLYISILTHTECFSGKNIWEKKEALQTLKLVFSGLQILPLEKDLSEKAGEIRAKYGMNIADAIISATALSAKLDLATLNVEDFKQIKGITLS